MTEEHGELFVELDAGTARLSCEVVGPGAVSFLTEMLRQSQFRGCLMSILVALAISRPGVEALLIELLLSDSSGILDSIVFEGDSGGVRNT